MGTAAIDATSAMTCRGGNGRVSAAIAVAIIVMPKKQSLRRRQQIGHGAASFNSKLSQIEPLKLGY